jgi:hypothetical protein
VELWLRGVFGYYGAHSAIGRSKVFAEGSAHEPGEETVPELNTDEAIVFEEFFVVPRMSPYPSLTKILLMFHVQLHQLTPNAIAQLSKYF